jgi:hypothetical protein
VLTGGLEGGEGSGSGSRDGSGSLLLLQHDLDGRACSWEATAVAWTVAMAMTRSTGVMLTVAEVTATMSRSVAGGVPISKTRVGADLGWI